MIEIIENTAPSATATERKPRQTDNTKYLTPQQLASRWAWHVESVRRAIRQRRIPASVIYRRVLIPIADIERIEAAGRNDRQTICQP